jgi:oligopeptide/dipeptide ABC transporter ATP-binding protein
VLGGVMTTKTSKSTTTKKDNVLLEVNNLTTHFFTQDGVVKAVDGISYNVHEGEVVGIVGESGCGKSVGAMSVMKIIPNPPGRIVDGSVTFEGENLVDLNESEMRKIRGNRIAMVFQEPMTSLNPVLTVGRQLTETLELHQGLKGDELVDKAEELLTRVGIPDPRGRLKDYPHQFSGGMRQRVMIAIALSCDPKLIIADEPTTALDVTIQAQILELMQGLAKDFGTALIIITHNLGVVARYADRVIVMYAGKIIEEGSAEEIFHNPMHAYTRGLLASVPRLDATDHVRLQTIEGLPPDLIAPPPGCGFAPRCQKKTCKCSETPPAIVEIKKGHYIADCKCCMTK